MNKTDAFKKYSNDYQNPVLGAFIFYFFIKNFKQKTDNPALLHHLFIVAPLIMNVLFSRHIKKQTFLRSLIRDLKEDNLIAGKLQSEIDNYKEFSFLSIYMAEKIGLLRVFERGEVDIGKFKRLPNEKEYEHFVKSKKLASLFAKGDLFEFLSFLGVFL